ncbi:NfeD family protein [Alteribacillus bidgolensis]|uniref:Membrane-bound serine protease (ClpP class) n=1 Tax=Alteribacillus bidgolensis TaxID=930129 RepID=A0A1G8P192_9BACI|nr:nodulation protein NfeD [Alteribacillus bidgolensis]SDI85600.1 membrane-bound serine protease (ClpP class) [Alteribacillus bidgolensis]
MFNHNKIIVFLLFFIVFFSSSEPGYSQTSSNDIVYVLPVEQTVERGLEAFLERSVNEAEEAGADHIIFEIDTPGGAVDAAGNIAAIIRNAPVPTTAFVTDEAMSAGAFIALNADEIAMAPSTEMGAAQVIDGSGNAASDKAQSAWIKNMKGAAELNGRDPEYAIAMADPSVDLEEYRAGEGSLLSLTASEAEEVGYAEHIVEDREELLSALDLEGAEVQEADVSIAEHIARFVTNPIIIPILLSVGSLGLILELYSPGFGIPGIMGASSLFLFFFGHAIAGFAGMESIVLFIAGLVLMIIELFVPGFGIFGFLGIGAMIGSMILASFSTLNIVLSILIAAVVSIAAAAILFSVFGKRGPMKRLVLEESVNTNEGYISNVSRNELVGKTGKSLTPLRPSGSIIVGEERLDVVTEGGYIEQGENVKIVAVQGSRIIVRNL